ncbi:hypothetical protein [Massilia luteola]|uniref:hypothetical protein n=1 Tax=Massilia luteola TaxID=3081751 RepID=UPI002ACBF0D4|nr:hypothetical protein [Massilia sp. Gc5]
MSYYTITLSANKPVNMTVAGTVILIDDLGATQGLDITPSFGGRDLPKMPNRKKAFKFVEPYDAVTLTAPVDCTVALFLSKNDVSLGFADGSLVNVSGQVVVSNTVEARVPVDIGGGTVTVTADNVGINNDDAHPVPIKRAALSILVDARPVVANTGAAQVLSNDATLKRLTVRNNDGAARVAIGNANVTMNTAAIILEPGDSYVEDDAAGVAWYVTSDTAGADVRVMGAK